MHFTNERQTMNVIAKAWKLDNPGRFERAGKIMAARLPIKRVLADRTTPRGQSRALPSRGQTRERCKSSSWCGDRNRGSSFRGRDGVPRPAAGTPPRYSQLSSSSLSPEAGLGTAHTGMYPGRCREGGVWGGIPLRAVRTWVRPGCETNAVTRCPCTKCCQSPHIFKHRST